MKHIRKAYVVGGSENYCNWMETQCVNDMRKADFVVFSGGEDVTPALYNREPHPTTCSSAWRDSKEVQEFSDALSLRLPMIGICRGSQFLCVMAGGHLVQHQSHPPTHEIMAKATDDTGAEIVRQITVTSTHHQRQFPWLLPKDEFKLYGWCNLSPFSYGEDKEDLSTIEGDLLPEVEIGYYPKIRALAIQSHPEMAFYGNGRGSGWCETYIEHCRMLLNRLLENKL